MSNPKLVIEITEQETDTHFGVGVMLDVTGITKESSLKNYYALKLKEHIADSIKTIRDEIQQQLGSQGIYSESNLEVQDNIKPKRFNFDN